MLPNFVHIGTPKSGSGTMSRILHRHPQIFTPRPKELNFFNSADFGRGLQWYEKTYFSDYADEPLSCDKSIGYATGDYARTVQRIADSLGRDVRVLITVRHPVERAYSQYCMARFKGQFETMSFTDAVADALAVSDEDMRIAVPRLEAGDYYSDATVMSAYRRAFYIVPGLYASLYRLCRDTFGEGQVLLVFTEDMAADLAGEVGRLTDFLGIDPIEVSSGLRANEATSLRYPWLRRIYNRIYGLSPVRALYDSLGLGLRRMLRRNLMSWNYQKNESVPHAPREGQTRLQTFYLEDMRELAQLTGRNLDNWIKKYPVTDDRQ